MRRIAIGLSACAVFVIATVTVAGPPRTSPPEHGEVAASVFGLDLPALIVPNSDYDNENVGLPKAIKPEVLTWDRIYALALIRARTRRGAFSPTLDPAALAVEAAREGVADFARFRTSFYGNGPFQDPGPSVLELQVRLLAIDRARRNVAFHESVHLLMIERSQGNSTGVTRLDVDMVFAALIRARQKVAEEIGLYRDGLDQLKFLLGLSPRAPVVIDRQNLQAFPAVIESVENWERNTKRWAQALPELIEKFPVIGDVMLNSESILEKIEKNPDRWEDVLAGARELAFKSRGERDEVRAQPNSGIQLELRVRRRIRNLYDKRLAYQTEKRCYELAVRLKDQAFERLEAPPSPAVISRSFLVNGVIEQQARIVETQDRLVALWTSFRAERLALYHDLGALPYQDWKSFYADLAAAPAGAAPEVPAVQPNPRAGDARQPPAPPSPPRP
jgi:hypothetical protein